MMSPNEFRPLEEAKRAWARANEGLTDREVDRRAHGFGVLVRGIAEQGSVSPSAFAEALDLEPAAARDLFESLATAGVEFDEDGHVIGAALTTRRTSHEISLGNRTSYAWCALDESKSGEVVVALSLDDAFELARQQSVEPAGRARNTQ